MRMQGVNRVNLEYFTKFNKLFDEMSDLFPFGED